MNTLPLKISRTALAVVLAATISVGTSCMTTYDSYGRPVQSVDPGLAVAGIAAAGLIGAAAANNHHHHHGYYRSGYYRGYPRGYYGGVSGGHYRGPRYYGRR